MKVKDSLLNLALRMYGIRNPNSDDDTGDFKAISDEFYYSIKSKLAESSLITTKTTKEKEKTNKKNTKLKKIDVMRMENTVRIIQKELETAERMFDYESFSLPTSFKLKIVELRGIGFLQCMKYLLQNKKEYLDANGKIKKKKIQFAFGIIIASEKYIDSVKDFEGQSMLNPGLTSKISQEFIQDFIIVLNQIKLIFGFDGMLCFYNAPQLIYYTDFDSAIPKKGVKPYEYQEKLTNIVYSSLKNPDISTVISLRTMTGTGKTSSVVSIAKTVMQYNSTVDESNRYELLFCCNQRSVLNQAAQWLFNAEIPFATAFMVKDYGLKIKNNWNCKSDDKRQAIVLSPDACDNFLTMNEGNFVLFLDEPTIGADTKALSARMNTRIMMNLPRIAILSSATLPADLYPWLKENHEIKYPTTQYHDIYSNRIHIGCDIKTFNGELVVPHMGAKSGDELRKIVTATKGLPFLGRSYTVNVVHKLYDSMLESKCNDVPNIPEMFKDIKNLGTDAVRELAMTMLEILSTYPDEIVTKVCSTKIDLMNPQLVEVAPKQPTEDDDIVWESEEKEEVTNEVRFDLLGTSHAHKYLQQNLIATTDPVKFAEKYFVKLLTDVRAEIGSLKKLESHFQQELALWQKEIQRMEKNKREYSSQLERLQKEEEMVQSRPSPNFPSRFQINTAQHCREYAKKSKVAIDRYSIRNELKLSDIPYATFDVRSDLILLLFCGVGVYTPGLCQNYLSSVMALAESGSLAYFISDESVCYGTNWPIRRVFIEDEFSEIHSINTIYQYLSRAGRIGKSWIAEGYISNKCAKKIIETLQSTSVDIESANLNSLYEDICSENIKRDQELMDMIEELARQKEEKERQLREKEEAERLEKEQQKRDRLEKEQRERDRLEKDRLEKLEKERMTKESFKRKSHVQSQGQSHSQVQTQSQPRQVQTSVTNITSVTNNPVSTTVIANDFARKSTGNVVRRSAMSRTDRLNALKKN